MLGSIDLPLGIASMSIFGSVAISGGIVPMVWYAFAGVFLYDFGAHIATTFKDIEEDRKTGIVTTPIQIGVKPALFLSTIATIGAFMVFIIPYAINKVESVYLIWVGLSFGTTAITRLPLLLRQDESNGYLALKGSMIGALALYPCLISTVFSIHVSSAIILGAYMVSLILIEITSQKV
ncbi:hypothetical protein GF312_10000 [Candidatus Poribacteria bacterium]|nr:hypothetical protein [Candidatus Poribacteria bacterium]